MLTAYVVYEDSIRNDDFVTGPATYFTKLSDAKSYFYRCLFERLAKGDFEPNENLTENCFNGMYFDEEKFLSELHQEKTNYIKLINNGRKTHLADAIYITIDIISIREDGEF